LKAWLEHYDNIAEPPKFHVLPMAVSIPESLRRLIERCAPWRPTSW